MVPAIVFHGIIVASQSFHLHRFYAAFSKAKLFIRLVDCYLTWLKNRLKSPVAAAFSSSACQRLM